MNLAAVHAVLLGGAIAGVLDIVFAISFAACNGATPVRLLQTVASGLLGADAFQRGLPAAALGLAAHFVMSLLWAAGFVIVARWVPWLARHPLPAGIVFGVLVFFTMRLVVLPLSAFPYPVTFKPLATVLAHAAVRRADRLGRPARAGGRRSRLIGSPAALPGLLPADPPWRGLRHKSPRRIDLSI